MREVPILGEIDGEIVGDEPPILARFRLRLNRGIAEISAYRDRRGPVADRHEAVVVVDEGSALELKIDVQSDPVVWTIGQSRSDKDILAVDEIAERIRVLVVRVDAIR